VVAVMRSFGTSIDQVLRYGKKKMNPSRARATDPSKGWSRVCAENLQFVNLLGPDDFVRIFDVVVGELRDVVQAVLIDTDVNELRDIGDDSFEDPVRLHVGELSDASLKVGAANLSPGGASGLVELFENVGEGEGDGREL
jgi:hypothetical protein